MMTIKVVEQNVWQKEMLIHLYEGEQVAYTFFPYQNKEDFISTYRGICDDAEQEALNPRGERGATQVLYSPKKVISFNILNNIKAISKENRKASGSFLCIHFGSKDKVDNCLLIQDATIYIIQEGQTVDTIKC